MSTSKYSVSSTKNASLMKYNFFVLYHSGGNVDYEISKERLFEVKEIIIAPKTAIARMTISFL